MWSGSYENQIDIWIVFCFRLGNILILHKGLIVKSGLDVCESRVFGIKVSSKNDRGRVILGGVYDLL